MSFFFNKTLLLFFYLPVHIYIIFFFRTIPVYHNGKQKGELNYDAVWYPIVKTEKDKPVPESSMIVYFFAL